MTDVDEPPHRVDLRPLLAEVRDQGIRNTCLAFAVTAAHEAQRAFHVDTLEDLAEEVLYWGCKQIDSDLEPGTTFPSARAALSRWGQPAEELWPYDENRDETAETYGPPLHALDPRYCHKNELQPIIPTVSEIKQRLSEGRTIAIGILIGAAFAWSAGGHIPLPRSKDEIGDGHALLVVGYEEGSNSEDGVLIFRNSWGPNWGDGGYGYLPYAYLEQFGGVSWILSPDHTEHDVYLAVTQKTASK